MTLAGIWQNEYGSRMSLVARGTAVSGIYDSTTGATGRYLVTGTQGETDATPEAGQPVAFTISWRSIAPGPPDAGWHWASALGGQISVVDGDEVLVVSHLLVASGQFDGLCQRGLYSDKLTFRRVAWDPNHSDQVSPAYIQSEDALTGVWRGADGSTIEIAVRADTDHRLGFVTGTLRASSKNLSIIGFTDIKADQDGLEFQAAAFAALDTVRNETTAVGGWIDHADDRLKIQALVNHSTGSEDLWLQTQLTALTLERVG